MLNKKFLIDITREVLNHAQQENLRKLEQISLLTDNWNGNGAKAFDKQLVAKVVEKMRREKRKIIPLCPFAKHEFDKTREYDDIRS